MHKTYTISDLSLGDVIEYSTFGGDKRVVKIEYLDEDIKNGRAGFDGRTIDMDYPVWGYCEQITRIVRKHEVRD